MKKFIAQPSISQSAVVQTKTLTTRPADGLVAPERREVTTAFFARPVVCEGIDSVEEDSTDMFTLERCSPLNDF